MAPRHLYLLFFVIALHFTTQSKVQADNQKTAPETPTIVPETPTANSDIPDASSSSPESSSPQESYAYKAEVNRLLDIIINHLYTQKDRFMREIVSNSVDALEKIRLQSLGNTGILGETTDLYIKISLDAEKQTITIFDTGIGMTKADLINNLGTVAKSGTTNFLEAMAETGDANLIGQFGVGFYSAFLVADKVTVYSKHTNDDQYVWESSADAKFTIEKDPEGNTLGRGTKIVLHVKQDATEFLKEDKLEELVQKFSQFMPFPIYIWKEKTTQVQIPEPEKENEDPTSSEDQESGDNKEVEISEEASEESSPKYETQTFHDWEHVNTQKPIWMRSKTEVTDKEYHAFYQTITKDYNDPLAWTHFSAEGEIDFKALLYIPKQPPKELYDIYNKKSSDVKLYARRVLVADALDELLPKYLTFVKGVIDSDDIPLNVAREQLQEHKIIKSISKKCIRKIMELLKTMHKESEEHKEKLTKEIAEMEDSKEKEDKQKALKEPTPFDTLWKNYGPLLQIGCYEDETNSKKILPLLQFKTNLDTENFTTIDNYIERMDENQQFIYYLSGEFDDSLINSPHLQKFNNKKIEVLFSSTTMCEACLQKVSNYKEKRLVSIQKDSLEIPEDADEKTTFKKLEKMYKPLTKWFSKLLEGKVKNVELSKTLVNDPCAVISSQYGYSAQMEKSFRAQSFADKSLLNMLNSMKIFQLNPHHPLIKSMLSQVKEQNTPNEENNVDTNATESAPVAPVANAEFENMGFLLYHAAMVSSGFEIADNKAMADSLYAYISKTKGIDPNTPIIEVDVSEVIDDPDTTDTDTQDPDLNSGDLDSYIKMNEQIKKGEIEIPDSFSSIDEMTGKPKTKEFEDNLEKLNFQIKNHEASNKDEL